ncbi:ABC transporter substrate-binding protein [Bacillus idriensis]|uniref:ABC transporter substrate-binding protein n=1 Tax=Metabacillus idriensis TaxID=324768 RepID=A0A6I2MDR8_9BACI|nr:iron-siderophore ABC transporter substrate-binding protein [Metabacillus idriensis]MRX54551.1 ABC transporter substrate-binding protein [Metabacillus idriensis]
MQATYQKAWLALIAIVLSAVLLAACGNGEKEESADTGSKDKESEAYTVEHAMGTTEIKKKPEKVVILTNEGTEALLALGVTPVGAVKSWLGDPWYDHISDEMTDVEVVGDESALNVEAIAALKPDLIIGNKLRQEDQYEKLSQIAPTVFSETLKGQWKDNFEFYAKALDREEEGKKVIADYDARINEIKEKAGDKLNKDVSVVRFLAGSTRIYYKDSFSGVILEQLGFSRPANLEKLFSDNPDDLFAREVTKELIPEMEGDILFYFTYAPAESKADAEKTAEEWTKDPLWQNLYAVKSGKAYQVDDAIWNTAGGVKAANLMLDDIEKLVLEK